MRLLLASILVLSPVLALAQSDDEPRAIAEAYLKAATGEGDEKGKDLLLGGITSDASLFTLENGKILSADPVRKEHGDLAKARALVADLDNAGKAATKKIMSSGDVGDDLNLVELSPEEAKKVMAPTKTKAQKLLKTFPVLSKALRVDKELYWQPKNPMRRVLAQSGKSGQFDIEIHRFVVQSFEGPRKVPRKWGLKVLRFKAPQMDTGWKVLAASDWGVE